MSLSFCCNIWKFWSQIGVNNMNTWIHPARNQFRLVVSDMNAWHVTQHIFVCASLIRYLCQREGEQVYLMNLQWKGGKTYLLGSQHKTITYRFKVIWADFSVLTVS